MVDDAERSWFDRYLDAFAAAARGTAQVDDIIGFYAVPLMITTDDAVMSLLTESAVRAAIDGQLSELRSNRYGSTTARRITVSALNATSALVTAEMMRFTQDGTEIDSVTMTYLVVHTHGSRKIGAMAVHT